MTLVTRRVVQSALVGMEDIGFFGGRPAFRGGRRARRAAMSVRVVPPCCFSAPPSRLMPPEQCGAGVLFPYIVQIGMLPKERDAVVGMDVVPV